MGRSTRGKGGGQVGGCSAWPTQALRASQRGGVREGRRKNAEGRMKALRTATGGAAHGRWGRRKARNDEERTKPAQVNQTKSDQIKPNPTKSDQIKPDRGRFKIKARAV